LIRVFQSSQMGPIRVYKRARPQDAPHPIHDPEDEFKARHQGKVATTTGNHLGRDATPHAPGTVADRAEGTKK
jgi:hypothetical protein